MTKVKINYTTTEQKEVDLEYPIYLYYQDELCNDELIKVDEKQRTIIKYDVFELSIKETSLYYLTEQDLKAITTKEHFDEVFNEALSQIKNAAKGLENWHCR